MKTQLRAGKARTAVGLGVLAFVLVVLPIATANVTLQTSCCQPPSVDQEVASNVNSLVSTETQSAASATQSAQATPLPSPPLTSPTVPTTIPSGALNAYTGGPGPDDDDDDDDDVTTKPTNTPTPSISTRTSTSLAKCATCTPNLRAPGAVAGLAAGDAGSAADAVSQGERADLEQPHVKDLTQESGGDATPPAAVPGFGPAFALAGLGLLAWARRRASG